MKSVPVTSVTLVSTFLLKYVSGNSDVAIMTFAITFIAMMYLKARVEIGKSQ